MVCVYCGGQSQSKEISDSFFDSKNKLAEVFSELSLPPAWKVVKLFYAQKGEMPFKCPKDKCTKYAIIADKGIR